MTCVQLEEWTSFPPDVLFWFLCREDSGCFPGLGLISEQPQQRFSGFVCRQSARAARDSLPVSVAINTPDKCAEDDAWKGSGPESLWLTSRHLSPHSDRKRT